MAFLAFPLGNGRVAHEASLEKRTPFGSMRAHDGLLIGNPNRGLLQIRRAIEIALLVPQGNQRFVGTDRESIDQPGRGSQAQTT